MNSILTQYIYPLENEIQLSKSLGIVIGNARNADEIKIIRDYLKVSLDSSEEIYKYYPALRLPMDADNGIASIKGAVRDLKTKYQKSDNYVNRFFKANSSKDIFEILAKIWIVIRYENRIEFEVSDYSELSENSKILVDYSYLLSLLTNKVEDYDGRSFVLHNSETGITLPKIDRGVNLTLVRWSMLVYPPMGHNEYEDEDKWRHFPIIKDALIDNANSLEKIFETKDKNKFLYIASLLKSADNEIKDEKFRLITLVSVIELLLTRNPDTGRFNVEDSISKQFKLKAGTLIYLNDKNIDLEWMKKRLTEIYNQRSNIAHGNFKTHQDWINKEKKQKKDEWDEPSNEMIIGDMNIDIYRFIRAILEEYIKDSAFVDFLKNS